MGVEVAYVDFKLRLASFACSNPDCLFNRYHKYLAVAIRGLRLVLIITNDFSLHIVFATISFDWGYGVVFAPR